MFDKDLEKVYSKNEWQRQWTLFHLFRKWDAIVGKNFSQVTMPAFFRQQVLWIYVENSSWMQHLQYIKPDLLQGIHRTLPDANVEDIHFALYPSDLPEKKVKKTPLPRSVDAEAEVEIKGLIQGISDGDCQEALYNLWRAHEQLGQNSSK
ncbi:DUF721 domain-containing protein [Desulfogranum japonicum]|uniref:DUF721 domain-containing protein n=1 Tax=Desulfogranum japonicum TaxID=231447 RepID=UPI0003F7602A|nr:DUF721 domain-containing protein [Desulfogranum japonicum]